MKKVKSMLTAFVFFVLGMICFSSVASAYIDPSAVTYIVQIIAGVVIAGGAAFAFYFRKLKRKVLKKRSDAPMPSYDKQLENNDEDDAEFDDSDIDSDGNETKK